MLLQWVVLLTYFNSRPSARGDGSNVNLQRAAILISIHAPPRGATKPRRPLRATLRDFNSRPSARGDRRRGRQRKQSPISIHAPPRGATATITDAATGQLFQFTPLREGRLCGFPTTFALQISIHAPPRGATHQLLDGKICFAISIHAPPRGATCGAAHSSRQIAFQFTPLREGRPPGRSPRRSSLYFNSRPSARGDSFSGDGLLSLTVFQFTPLREGRPFFFAILLHRADISIHAPPRGATSYRRHYSPISDTFQFTPLREGRPKGSQHMEQFITISIHAPPRGATNGRID